MPAPPATLVRPEKALRADEDEWVAVTRMLWMVRPFSTLSASGAETDMLREVPPSSGNMLMASDWLRWYCIWALSTTAVPARPTPPRPPRPPPPAPPPRPPWPRWGVPVKLCVRRRLMPSLFVADVVVRRKFCEVPGRFGNGK
jgi:hypothetical protein